MRGDHCERLVHVVETRTRAPSYTGYAGSLPMCGIVGYTGLAPLPGVLWPGSSKLEYRGYDSAGLSLIERRPDRLGPRRRATSSTSATRINGSGSVRGAAGIGHTRWATHGRVTEDNCHPHYDTSGRVHVVLNGIVEN